jgi:hypothetical protein
MHIFRMIVTALAGCWRHSPYKQMAIDAIVIYSSSNRYQREVNHDCLIPCLSPQLAQEHRPGEPSQLACVFRQCFQT